MFTRQVYQATTFAVNYTIFVIVIENTGSVAYQAGTAETERPDPTTAAGEKP